MSDDTTTPDREMPMIERIARALALLQYPAEEHDQPAVRLFVLRGAEMTARTIPIRFSAEMVRAILDGRKTQTRRVLKPQPVGTNVMVYDRQRGCVVEETTGGQMARLLPARWAPGDTLWVRETWNIFALSMDAEVSWPFDEIPKEDPRKDEDLRRGVVVDYAADYHPCGPDKSDDAAGPWRHSIHMPRWAARLHLRVTDVRVQRLQAITSAGAIAEGFRLYANSATIDCATLDPRDDFASAWNGMNPKHPWDSNPWVAAITFERIKP